MFYIILQPNRPVLQQNLDAVVNSAVEENVIVTETMTIRTKVTKRDLSTVSFLSY